VAGRHSGKALGPGTGEHEGWGLEEKGARQGGQRIRRTDQFSRWWHKHVNCANLRGNFGVTHVLPVALLFYFFITWQMRGHHLYVEVVCEITLWCYR
jgi:hypothetical protein